MRLNPSAIRIVAPRQVGKIPATTPTTAAAARSSQTVEGATWKTGKNCSSSLAVYRAAG